MVAKASPPRPGRGRPASKTTKPVFVGVNKIDDPSLTNLTAEFYALGLENVYPVSGITGSGTGDLLDAIVKHFKPIREEEDSDDLRALP